VISWRTARRSLATVSLSGSLEDKLEAAAAAGFDGVELFENDLINCPRSPAEIRERLHELELELVLYQPFRDFEAVPSELLSANTRRAERKFALMEALGADTILVCSNVSEHAIDDDRLAAAQLGQLAERAAAWGIRVAYEALAWGRHVNTFEHAWRIVEEAEHPNLGICLDSFHVLARGDDPEPIAAIPGERIFFVQLADAPMLSMDLLQWSRHHRCPPGQGSLAVTSFVEHVLDAGYSGPLSLELFNDVLRQASSTVTAVDAMRSLLTLEDSLARRRPDLVEQAQLAELPAPARLPSYAFAELSVDPIAQSTLEHVLAPLGFTRTGQHRTKPVELWRHGAAQLLLNHGEGSGHALDAARLSTVGLDSTDPARSEHRAQQLLAPRLPRRRGPGEADLTAIAVADGMSVFLCSEQADRWGWAGDFVALHSVVPTNDHDLTGIDHIALCPPFESFDHTVFFFSAVLGMRPSELQELSAPDGMVRSQALASDDGQVRVVLNAPRLGFAREPDQHVAFGCKDIFATCERVSDRGLPVLAIPVNYYDDLAARFPLEDRLLSSMQALGILYDRDRHGEFFHFYTTRAGEHLFFEIVERRGGYNGYGAVNSSVRMTAQRA
jgi:4-hydroxyphenylpyruvate dioxygenase